MQFVLGLVLVFCGCAGVFFIGRRKFLRRNMAGIEEFGGYTKMLVTRFGEVIVKGLSLLCILGGIAVMIASGNSQQHIPKHTVDRPSIDKPASLPRKP